MAPIAFGKVSFQRCPACGFILKDRLFHPTPEAERARYERHRNAPGDGYDELLETFLERSVLPFRSHKTALDFGCGNSGRLIELLRRKGFAAQCYDPFYAPDPAVLKSSYDLVTATEVVEHFRDPEASWRLLSALVAPGGILAVTTRFLPADFDHWWYRRDETHLCFYTEQAIASIALRFGLKVLHTDLVGAITFHRD